MDSHKRPLLALLLNALLITAAGLYGLIGLLLEGQWVKVGVSLVAMLCFPVALITLHWLRWLIDIPALFAAEARYRLLTGLLVYLSGLFIHILVLGWVALAISWIAAGHPTLPALAWGYAVVAGPLLLVILRPFSYPLMLWLYGLAQLAYPLAWAMLQFNWITPENTLAALALLAILSPLVQFSRRWRQRTQPD